MLRPRVTHSAAHRNIRQKRPWMEYSGTTSWGSEGERSMAWCQDQSKLQWYKGVMRFRKYQPTMISELEGLSGLPFPPSQAAKWIKQAQRRARPHWAIELEGSTS